MSTLDTLKNEVENFIARSDSKLMEMEQSIASANAKRVEAAPKNALIETIENSNAIANFHANGKASFEISNATTTSAPAETGTGGALQSFVESQRLPGVLGSGVEQPGFLDFVPKASTASNMIEYTKLTETDGADATAEDSALPVSDYQFAVTQTPVQKIGSYLVVTQESLSDAPSVAQFINQRLAYNVTRELERQILLGDGTSPNLDGIIGGGNTQSVTQVAADNGRLFVRLRKMIAKVQSNGFGANVIVMGPDGLAALDCESDTTNAFIASDPRAFNLATAWSLPIVVSHHITGTNALVTDARQMTMFERQGTTVELFEQDGNQARSSLVTVRGTARAAIACYAAGANIWNDLDESL